MIDLVENSDEYNEDDINLVEERGSGGDWTATAASALRAMQVGQGQ